MATTSPEKTDTGGSALRIESVSHQYGALPVLDKVSTEIGAGEFLTLLGASGSGKTTLLRIIGGLITPSSGRVYLGGRDITHSTPERRDIGFVFQNYALFPHLTVAENIAFSLTVRKLDRAETVRRVTEAIDMVGLSGLASRYPGQLSGGQQQRVALARAIVFRPGMLLLDEPLGALDRQLRQQLAVELRGLQRRSGITMIYVTHDQEEAFTMSTQVAIMHNGAIRQMAPPHHLFGKPDDLMVARFVGDLNSFPGTVRGTEAGKTVVETAIGTIFSDRPDFLAKAGVTCAVRPEHVRLSPLATHGNAFPARVIFGGSWHRIEYALPSGVIIRAEGRGEPEAINEGDDVFITFDASRVMLFKDI
ncbi:ABC transporter ATP-binding protein [Mesorhizobium sp. AR07]|uniref:ABC transporter ATP-binding protein n=1 Tax=Mesorhizobium sp. AR07 TaxID=2865838 RepID=UPI00215F4FC1|nr:ABC transporter ATP-binding protein [Mesorhizobium sp. AR07]UVK43992.1 ABC transporter ATP-binding protein [Mesorhizobium sp. AR07]